jgi:hypothetical protein
MNRKLIFPLAISLCSLVSSCTFLSVATEKQKADVVFECGSDRMNGEVVPATIATTQNRSVVIIRWNPRNFYFGKDWSPLKRCQEVAARFQKLHDRDDLRYITADQASWLPDQRVNVVCGVTQEGARCTEADLLFTLESKDDPNEVLSELIALRERPRENQPLTRGSNFDGGRRVYYDLSKELEILSSSSSGQDKKAF